MLNISCSHSSQEILAHSYEWPSTTSPWVVATALVAKEGGHSSLHTFTSASGLHVAGWMSSSKDAILSAECSVFDQGMWTSHRVADVLLGYIGTIPVAAFRDDRGFEFCPDAPEVPPSQLTDIKLVRTIKRIGTSPELGKPPS